MNKSTRVTDIDLITEVKKMDELGRKGQDITGQHKKVVSMITQYNYGLDRDLHMSISKTRSLIEFNHIQTKQRRIKS